MAKQTKYLALQGKCKWATLDRPDTKFNLEGEWSIRLYPTPESYEKILELKKEGLKNVIKHDEDGYSIMFKRRCQKVIRGKIRAFPAPRIEDRDGNPLEPSFQIGNGSDVTITVEIYYHMTPAKVEAPAARLSIVRVDNLVPFSREEYPRADTRAARALDSLPPQAF